MAMKRLFPEECDDGSPPVRKRPTFWSVGREVMRLQLMQKLWVPILEPTIRRVVREEVEQAFLQFIHPVPRPVNQIQFPGAIGPHLHFNSTLPDTLFTGSRILQPVQIVICSGNSKEPLRTDPLSSIRVEVVVLDGDFGKDGVEWTKEEFDANVLRERDGRRPLLTGDLAIALRGGVGTFANITFTDNSSWIRSRRFRLGFRVVQGSCIEGRVKEAISEAFVVKDHRGELYKKHESPKMGDEIWRLKNIGRDGVFRKRLTEYGIETVHQFLQFLVTDPSWLRSILGSGMSNKVWEETVSHARRCILDDKFYLYFSPGREVGLLLNSIYEVVKVTFDDCESFRSLDDLNLFQKKLVENLKQEAAYRKHEGIVEYDGLPFFGPSKVLPELQADYIPEMSLSVQNHDFSMHQNELAMPDFKHPINPPQAQVMIDLPPQLRDFTSMYDLHLSQAFAAVHGNSLNTFMVDQPQLNQQDLQLTQQFALTGSNVLNMNDLSHVPHEDYGNEWSASGLLAGTIVPDKHLPGECSQVQPLNWLSGSLPVLGEETVASGFPNHATLPGLDFPVSGNCSAKQWRKLGAPLKWSILVRKGMTPKRMAEFCA